MGPAPLFLLLSVMVLGLAAAVVEDEDEYTWPQREMPVVLDKRTLQLQKPAFRAEPKAELRGMCGIECQRTLPRLSQAQLEQLLSYETVYENGTRLLTEVSLQGLGDVSGNQIQNVSSPRSSHSRRKRQVFGEDSRFVIADKQFSTSYPFSATVKVSTGCSGVLLSPRHVLTAAHCIHDGQDYLKGAKKLRVGFLKLRSKRRGGGSRRRGGKRREEEGGRGEGRKGKKRRSRRSAEAKQPSFRWTRVKQTQIPKGWLRGVSDQLAVDYDYALLELKRPPKLQHMDLGAITSAEKLPAGRIHFSGFDDDRLGQLVYRFCSVLEESNDLLYQYCDAQPGSSGSGVYIRLKEPGKRKWKRKIIGVFSGHRVVDMNGTHQDYNVAVRISPLKYAQICHWIHGDSSQCQNP